MKANFLFKIELFVTIMVLHTGCTFDFPKSASGTCGADLQWTLDYETRTLSITGSGSMEDYNLHPETDGVYGELNYSTAPWAGNNGCARSQAILEVELSQGITSIGNNAFYNFSVYSISIPGSVTKIGKRAFRLCVRLNNLTISEGVAEIGEEAFRQCAYLGEVTIPASVVTIKDEAFAEAGRDAYEYSGNFFTVICEAVNPPKLGNKCFDVYRLGGIYVPAQSLDLYKKAAGWKEYASYIHAIY